MKRTTYFVGMTQRAFSNLMDDLSYSDIFWDYALCGFFRHGNVVGDEPAPLSTEEDAREHMEFLREHHDLPRHILRVYSYTRRVTLVE